MLAYRLVERVNGILLETPEPRTVHCRRLDFYEQYTQHFTAFQTSPIYR